MFATDRRISSLQDDLTSILAASSFRAPLRKIASVSGKIISLGNCVLRVRQIRPRWIPRDLNSIADDTSKFIDYDDDTIYDTVFDALDDLWGSHTCYRFACSYNAKVQCLNSRFYQPSSSGENAFAQDWFHHDNWLCPLSTLRAKSSATWSLAALRELSSYHSGSLPAVSGLSCVQMVSTGIPLFVIGDWVILPNLSNLFIRCKPETLFLVVNSWHGRSQDFFRGTHNHQIFT